MVLAAPPAAEPQAPAPAVRAAREQYKNLQVLGDIPANEMIPTMHLITGQLGVGCQYCHIWEEWDREDKPAKQVARRMMLMTADINRRSFGGMQGVTCYTCHRSEPKPDTMVALPIPPPPPHDAPEPAAPMLPSVDEVLDRYVRALGGEQALRRVTSRVITGKQDFPTGAGGLIPVASDVEIYQKAPNLIVNVHRTAMFTVADGFDGVSAWTQTTAGAVNTLPNPDQQRTRRRASMYEPLEFKGNYTRMDVAGLEDVGARHAYVVVAVPEGDTAERLYFDTETGLLLRRAVHLNTAAGPSPYQVDFEDYRDSGGVKVPFVVRMTPATQRSEIGTRSTIRVERVRNNVDIPDDRFTRPAPRLPAAR
jgi:photosynthetic reaction center cytochrome c subunit